MAKSSGKGGNTGSKGGGRGSVTPSCQGGNWPSTTGKPSGGGRSNAAPKGK